MFSLDPRGGHNRYKFEIDFFKKWSPEMAYVLGFLYADGDIEDVRKSSRTQYITFASVDKEILESVKKALGSQHNLNYRAPRKITYQNGKEYESSGIYRLRIGSKKMFDDLIKLGLTPRKSLTIKFPKSIPGDCLNHFVRGYFDGDGCVYLQKAKGVTKSIIVKRFSVIFTSGSFAFLDKLGVVLKNQLGLIYKKLYDGNRAFQLRYDRSDSVRLFKFLYKSCPQRLYLRRKFDIFKNYFKLRPQKIDPEITSILNNFS